MMHRHTVSSHWTRGLIAGFAALISLMPLAGADDTPRLFELEGKQLTLKLPDLEGLTPVEQGLSEQRRGFWTGKLGASDVAVSLWILPGAQFGFDSPQSVLDLIEENRVRREKAFRYVSIELLEGEFGYAPFARLARSEYREEGTTRLAGNTFFLASLLPEDGYMVEVECRPAVTGDAEQAILDFLKKDVRYGGEPWEVRWTDEQAQARWERDAPETKGDFKVLRTDHYIIFTNSSGGKLFAKKMEQFYRQIQKLYPFEEIEGNRLMPVFLFKEPDEYYDYYVKVAKTTKDAAKRSKGHAWRDYYATWYEAPNDPTHLHEATHQIFGNRLRLRGGGSWFQEGVAEYISTSKNELNVVARAVREKEHTPMREFMLTPSMLYSASDDRKSGGSEAHDNYSQAALVIEFVHRSRLGRQKFDEFIHAVGETPRNDLVAIEKALQKTLGVSIEEFEEEFIKYCHTRR
ncbi:MAG: hypothetical protein RL885_32845 [Planctomycetota bacterium]